MIIDTLTLKMFIAIAETENFTEAAKKIFRTQSALSQRIKQLEEMIGKTLFKRDKKISLTHEGEIFLSYARKSVQLETEMLEHFHSPNLAGEFKFGLPEDFVSVFMQPILKEFCAIHPHVHINVECNLTLNLLNDFKKGDFDFVLLKVQEGSYIKEKGINIWQENLVWVAAQDEINLMEPINLVLSPSPCVYRECVLGALEKHHISFRIAFTSQSYAAKMSAVKAGLGITVLPKNMVPKDFYIQGTKTLPELPATHALMLKKSPNNQVVNSFEQFILNKSVAKSLKK